MGDAYCQSRPLTVPSELGKSLQGSRRRSPIPADEPQDDFAVPLAEPAYGPHAADDRRLDLDEALALLALHRPSCRALGQHRGDRVIDHIPAER
jgi:hypothetical protein